MRRAIFLGTVLAAFCSAQAARAETKPVSVDALRETVELLTRRVQEMESAQEAGRRRIRELEDRIVQLAAESAGNATAPDRTLLLGGGAGSGQGNLLNPQITAFFDMGGSLSSDGDNKARNRFNLRETELDLRGAVSPLADGVLVIAVGEEIEDPFGDVDVAFEVGIEEAYLNVHTLPGDLALKAGKFRSTFGRNNLLHTHDLPQVTRPLAVQAFLGPEGLTTIGASLDWIVPNPWDRYLELTTQVVNADGGSESPILGGPGAVNPALLSHLKVFQDVGDTGSLELGTSFLHTRTSDDRNAAGYVLGADAVPVRSKLVRGHPLRLHGLSQPRGATPERLRLGDLLLRHLVPERGTAAAPRVSASGARPLRPERPRGCTSARDHLLHRCAPATPVLGEPVRSVCSR
jgi:hypothetical protein